MREQTPASPVGLTVAEAAGFLDPPIEAGQLAELIHALRIAPNGSRPTGRRGKPAATYNANELIRLHTAVAAWLTRV